MKWIECSTVLISNNTASTSKSTSYFSKRAPHYHTSFCHPACERAAAVPNMGKLCPGRLQHITVPLSIYNDSWQMSKLLRILSLLPFPHLKANTILFSLLFVPCLAGLAKMCVTKVVLWSAVKIVIETPWFSSVKFHWTRTHFSFIHVFSPWPFNTHRHTDTHPHTHTHTHTQLPYWETGTCEQSSLHNGHNLTWKIPKLQGPKACATAPAVLRTCGMETWPMQQKQALHWHCSKRRNPSFEKKEVRN